MDEHKQRHCDYDPALVGAAAGNWARRRRERERYKVELATVGQQKTETPERVRARERFRQEAEQGRRKAMAGAKGGASRVLDSFSNERIIGARDFLGVEFLEMAMAVARFVGRVHIRERPGVTAGFGTGFVVSPRLFMTNHHVLPDRDSARYSEVEFDYQRDRFGRPLPVMVFGLEPDAFFLTDSRLDFTLVALSTLSTGGSPLESYAWVKLKGATGKALLGDPLNIIQHPQGEMKQLVLRSNRLADLFEDLIHYETDTQPGSSGSPVFSDSWDVVALHHSGVPKTNAAGDVLDIDGNIWVSGRDDPARISWIGNEGIRVSSLVKFIEGARLDTQSEEELRREMLERDPPHPMELALKTRAVEVPVNGSRIAADGEISITIPLHIRVSLGSPVTGQAPGSPAAAADKEPPARVPPSALAAVREQPPGVSPARASRDSGREREVLQAARRELGSRPEVLDVQLGYVFRDGWITDERAVVVTRRPPSRARANEAGASSTIPSEFQGMAVEVVDPSIEDMVRMVRGEDVAREAFARTINTEEIVYVPPSGVPLKNVKAVMRVIAHVSPDSGWPLLRKFLADTRTRLVVGMYDFGAPHIASALTDFADKGAFQRLTLVLQKGESVGEGTKKHDLHDEEVVEKLEAALGQKFEQSWVKIGRTNGWVASSYHIKVAVRDQQAFWLSSGNWQSSNQPDADPLHDHPRDRSWLDRYNREWHAIVEHAGLAKVFEQYLLHDHTNNKSIDGHEEFALPDLLVPESFFAPTTEEAAAEFQYFPPFNQERTFSVRPLLTPDNYHEHVLSLIKSAKTQLLIQNQTFNAPGPNHDKLRELVAAVLERQRAGVDVRVIFRIIDVKAARQNLSNLKDLGFDMQKTFKLQKNCHTKGIVVDRKRVLLGSQNWSNDGVSVNRDASLLFDDEELAEYFAGIFDHDWRVLARKKVPAAQPFEWVSADKPTPERMIRLGWKDYMEMM